MSHRITIELRFLGSSPTNTAETCAVPGRPAETREADGRGRWRGERGGRGGGMMRTGQHREAWQGTPGVSAQRQARFEGNAPRFKLIRHGGRVGCPYVATLLFIAA